MGGLPSSFDTKSGSCTLFKPHLHSPVDKVTALGKNLKAEDIHYCKGIIFLASANGSIKVIEFKDVHDKHRKED